MTDIDGFSISKEGSVSLQPEFITLMANAAIAAYTDFKKPSEDGHAPESLAFGSTSFDYLHRFTGLDTVPWGSEKEERFGLVYRWSESKDVCLIAFRGTSSPYDMWEDLESADACDFKPFGENVNFPKRVCVGEGFNHIYTKENSAMQGSMQKQLFALIDDLIEPVKHIIVTGHSLGCALCTQFALDLAVSRPNIKVTNVNFASPRVGTKGFAETYNNQLGLLNRTVRIRNHYDVVPKVPFKSWPFDFQHVGNQFLVSFSTKSFVHLPQTIVEGWHSMTNYQLVINNATPKLPQTWVGDFNDQADLTVLMESMDPTTHRLDWKKGELKKFLESTKSKL